MKRNVRRTINGIVIPRMRPMLAEDCAYTPFTDRLELIRVKSGSEFTFDAKFYEKAVKS